MCLPHFPSHHARLNSLCCRFMSTPLLGVNMVAFLASGDPISDRLCCQACLLCR